MKWKKFIASVIVVVFLITSLSLSTMAVDDTTWPDCQGIILPNSTNSTRQIDTSFSLDFSKSTYWTMDFDNNAPFAFNHLNITIKYISCSPSNSNAKVSIELYIDDNKDGVYEKYDPDGGYLYSLSVGEKYTFVLPYESTVKNYRIVFGNKTSSVTSGSFTMKTE